MIIAVGYRVSSPKATKFRQWATKILNEYIKKGFVLDDDSLKQGYSEKIISANCWKGYVLFVPVNGAFGNKSRIYMQNVVSTMTRTRLQHTIFMP